MLLNPIKKLINRSPNSSFHRMICLAPIASQLKIQRKIARQTIITGSTLTKSYQLTRAIVEPNPRYKNRSSAMTRGSRMRSTSRSWRLESDLRKKKWWAQARGQASSSSCPLASGKWRILFTLRMKKSVPWRLRLARRNCTGSWKSKASKGSNW
jgi:hypothetical protein